MKAMFDRGAKLPLLPAEPDECVDILSFVVTKAGWEALKHRLKISQSHRVRILTQLIYESAIKPIEQIGSAWHHLPGNHAKVILYRKQKVALLGSFNLTKPSLGDNIECFSQVAPADYDRMADEFDRLWEKTEQNKKAIKTRSTIAQAIADTLDDGEEEELDEETPLSEAETTEGPRRPWPFQEDIIKQVMAWLKTEKDADLGRIVKLPTGAGKTLVAAEVIRRLLEQKPQARILWVCHRVELLRQSWLSIRDQINGAIPPAAWFVPQHIEDESSIRDRKEFCRSKFCQVVFCTQGMLPHLLRHNRQNHFDLTVIDECHRFHPRSTWYRKLSKYCSDQSIPRLGLTATPLAPEKRGFGKYWAETMFGNNVSKEALIRDGFLSRFNRELTKRRPTNHTFVISQPDAKPERNERELLTRIREFNNDNVNMEVARAWQEYRGQRQRILCFAVTIDHAETLKSTYFAKDDSVRVAHSGLTTESRKNLIWFKDSDSSESRMLISVLMLAEGIDLPKTDCLFMVRPTFSPELYQQMIGRGLRGLKAEGTEDCAVVDFTSQYVDRRGKVLTFTQIATNIENDGLAETDGAVSEEDEEPDDLDASGMIETVKSLRETVNDLRDKEGITIHDACEELAQELDYTAHTLVNYYHTKADNYPLGWEDPETDPAEQSNDSNTAADRGSEMNGLRAVTHNTPANEPTGSRGNVTTNKLLDLRAHDYQQFEKIASLTDVASSTLRSYCSDQENFKRWKANNKDKMDQVRVILAEFLARHSDAA
ncbi:MAG: DEAD/DEAH box helicase family protein [Nitrospira sp.]|nr:DEAD/DEAH box helicase family protein [Nitrospira sp.]